LQNFEKDDDFMAVSTCLFNVFINNNNNFLSCYGQKCYTLVIKRSSSLFSIRYAQARETFHRKKI